MEIHRAELVWGKVILAGMVGISMAGELELGLTCQIGCVEKPSLGIGDFKE